MKISPSILLIEDSPQFRSLLITTLENQHYSVISASTGREGLMIMSTQMPSLLILDLGLPDIDGQEMICKLRLWSTVPIIVLSARNQESDITLALDNGADDYLTKPFKNAELLSRMRALLRRVENAPNIPNDIFHIDELKVDLTRRKIFIAQKEVHLTPIEFNLLAILVKNAGFVVTHRQLLQKIWGEPYLDRGHYLRIYMRQLRQKLEVDSARPHYLLTEAGIGYRLYAGEN